MERFFTLDVGLWPSQEKNNLSRCSVSELSGPLLGIKYNRQVPARSRDLAQYQRVEWMGVCFSLS